MIVGRKDLAHRRDGRWRHALGLASRYWLSADWKVAWSALLVLVALQFGVVYVMIAFNRWQQHLFDSIERRQPAAFAAMLLVFGAIIAAQVGTLALGRFLAMTLTNRWRACLTDHYLGRWLSHERYAEIERLRLIDNPDQRIAEDLRDITVGADYSGGVLVLALGFLQVTVGAISYAMILLETAEPIRLAPFGHPLSIPGSTIWYAVAYALLGSAATLAVGRPYVRRRMAQQHHEADFRANLIHVRRNAGQIGFAGALGVEDRSLRANFDAVRRNLASVIRSLIGVEVTGGVYERIGGLIPLAVTVPRYFAGAISFGQVMGARDAFGGLIAQLSFFIQSYPRIGAQVANVNRIRALDDALDHRRQRGIAFAAGTPAGVTLVARDLRVLRPHGEPLLALGDWTVADGERWLVEGPSGAGKSTLLRAIAGLWPDGSGGVAMTDRGTAMFVPQRLYLPLGTLKEAICFPDPAAAHDDAAIVALLDRVRLGGHADALDVRRVWQEELSPGEQQRLALARILLHAPDLLMLDEATSALDPDNARHFHETLLAALPAVTLVSVVHDPALTRYHTHRLTIAEGVAVPKAIA